MKKYLFFILAVLSAVPSLRAQSGAFVAGIAGVAEMPVGSLSDRFKPAAGGMIYAGQRTSPDWAWVGKFEYLELRTMNANRLFKTVKLQEGGGTQEYRVPLPGLAMRFRASGFTAEAITNLVRWSPLELNGHLGFGFYNWEFSRDAYNDSLFVVSTVTGLTTKAATLAVPDNQQSDWSGSINLGVDLGVVIAGPVSLTVGADYRLIIGELWPALDFDMENVSGIQMVTVRGGLKVEL